MTKELEIDGIEFCKMINVPLEDAAKKILSFFSKSSTGIFVTEIDKLISIQTQIIEEELSIKLMETDFTYYDKEKCLSMIKSSLINILNSMEWS